MSIKLKNIDLETKQGKLFTALVVNGESLSQSQIAKRFSIKNPTATISNIRQAGYAIYTNQRKAKNGVVVTEYRHGKASRKIIAAGYKAMTLGLVD
jgi:Mn-dependent DtxR family transcriptional regulator